MPYHVFYKSEEEYLAHSLKGLARKFHKYLLRIKVGNRYRYFYSQAEIDAYNKKNKKSDDENFPPILSSKGQKVASKILEKPEWERTDKEKEYLHDVYTHNLTNGEPTLNKKKEKEEQKLATKIAKKDPKDRTPEERELLARYFETHWFTSN